MKWQTFPITRKEAEKQEIPYSSKANRDAFFPKMLRKLRENAGISQLELSKALGVSKSTIGLYENGDTLPDVKTLRDIAKFYKISSDALLGLSITGSTDNEMQLICNKLRITDKAAEAIMDICSSPQRSWSFIQLVESEEFEKIIIAITGYLSINCDREANNLELLLLDEQVREKSGGALCVVRVSSEKEIILKNMQDYLSNVVQRIDRESTLSKRVSGKNKKDETEE